MMRSVLRASIQGATVNACNPDAGEGLQIDIHLMNAATLAPFEKISVEVLSSGSQLESFVTEGRADGSTLVAHGALARLLRAGDVINILSYGLLHEGQMLDHRPRIVVVDAANRALSVTEIPATDATGT